MPEDAGLLAMVRSRGIDARFVVWTDPTADWTTYDAVVAVGVWGYYQRYEQFLQWLSSMHHHGIALWNTPSLIRWNSDKRYLRDLAARGVRIVPTEIIEPGSPVRLAELLDAQRWTTVVVKPAISACAYRTFRTSRADADSHQAALELILDSCAALVQPFFPEVSAEGEWTLCFFDEVLSHAVLKTPAPQEYRVQRRYGGTSVLARPPGWLVDHARAVLHALPEPAVYARIDGVCRDREFYLMEAELIEPSWFFDTAPDAMARYVDLLATLATQPRAVRR
ncbi:hypothetical protein AB0H00_17600 [Nocardia sp. NPDC023852]|uniref:ATP-grasp domain-containing protein n=1 Tax=Nocardia sp. NPDC023852 TaxID=3154697 RepID=UPI0033D288B1